MIKHPFNIILVGQMGVGKTHFCKTILQNYPKNNVFVYDRNPQREYEPYSNNLMITRDEIIAATKKRYSNSIYVYEEATGLLRNRGGLDISLIDNLTTLRHLNTSNIFIFHSIRSIPVEIFDFIDKAVIFKTNDRPELVRQKYKGLFSENAIKTIRNLKKFEYLTFKFRE
jgi:GTPase SAR1 family protein